MLTAGRVTVVVAVRDGAAFIGDAVASVRAQTHPDVELIVVDDGSTDATAAIARALPVDRLVVLPATCGVSEARNIGAALATGELVTFLDADDVLRPAKLAAQVDYLRAHPRAGAVLTGQEIDLVAGVAPPDWLQALHAAGAAPPRLPISALIRTEALYAAGGFTPGLVTSEDIDLLVRLQASGWPVEEIAQPLVVRRVHGGNASYQTKQMQRDLLRALSPARVRADTPDVDVIIPVHDDAAFLGEAIASTDADGVRVRVTVVDDGSTDGTAAVAAAAGARVLTQPHAGAGAARNHGVLASRAPLVAFLDADDLWMPGKLAADLAVLAAQPAVDLVHGWTEEFAFGVTGLRPPLPPSPAPAMSAVVLRTAAFARVGPFALDVGHAEWIEWWARGSDAGLVVHTRPGIAVRRRLHAGQGGGMTGYTAVLRDVIRRRRAAEP